jgi:phosphohistidine phosphatase
MTDNSEALVYLVRHGEAKPKDEDPERPLSEAGEDDVVRMAVWAAETGIHVAAILHSGKLRAQQTAEVFADQLPESPVPRAVSGLAPNNDVDPIAKLLQTEQGPIMLVGHLPFLERLASFLVAGDADASLVTLDAGALLALAKNEKGWCVDYLMQPKLLPAP